MNATLTYVHDPMCSWCWAFRPTWLAIVEALPQGIVTRRLLGGLAPDSDLPMPDEMRSHLQATWRRIRQMVPGTEFNHAFWSDCAPRRSTYPACRAVIAATVQDEGAEEAMIRAIQHAYYLEARNPSDDATLTELAGELDLDTTRFASDLGAASTQSELLRQIELGRRLGAQGFPSLILEFDGGHQFIRYDYRDPQVTLDQIDPARAIG